MMAVTCLLIFNHFGRPFEYVLVGWRIPAVICSIGIVLVLAGGYLKLFHSRAGLPLLLLVAWMLISTPFSSWRAGSAVYLQTYIQFWIVLFLMIAGSPKSTRDLTLIAALVGLSSVFHILIGGSSSVDGRFELSGSSYGNADDVALLAGFAIPFVVLAASRLKNRLLRYPALLGGVGYLMLTAGRTATRAAIPAMILMMAVYFLRGRGGQKLAVVFFLVAAVVGAVFALPDSTLERLASLGNSFGLSDVESAARSGGGLSEADASLLERRKLVQDAIMMTLEHPLFGVGPGEFVDFRTKALEGTGDKSHNLPSHNTYLQVASELGFGGIILYLWFLGSLYASIRYVRKTNRAHLHPQWQLISQMVLAIEAAFVYFAVCAAFMTCDRHPQQFVLAGFLVALERMLASVALQPGKAVLSPGVRFAGGSGAGMKRVGPGKTLPVPGF